VNGITRYIFKQLLFGAVLVSAALSCIVWLTQSLRFLQFVVTKGLALSAWLKLTLYLLPGFLVVVIPPAFFFVTLFVYNKLIMDRELVVAQAAGVSRLALAKPAMLAAAAGALACAALTLYIAPHSVRAFRELQWSIRNDVSQVLLREGAFNQIAPGLTVYVRGRGAAGELEGIMVHDSREADRPVTLLAEHGVMAGTHDGPPHVMLLNGTRQQLDASGTTISILYFDSYTVDFGKVGDDPTDRVADYRERSLLELLSLGPGDGFSAREIGRMRAEAHQRLTGPLTVFAFTALALAFLLSGGFDRRGQLVRIGGAVVGLVILQAVGLGAIELVGRMPDMAVLMYMAGLLPTAIGLYIIARPVEWVEAGRYVARTLRPLSP
jgi:lipopolysaccharide export system permease protein